MDKLLTKVLKIMFSVVFIFIGIMMLFYVYSQPCDVGGIVTEQSGQQIITSFPSQLERLLCLQASAESLILTIISVSLLFGGVSYLLKNLLS